MELAKKRERQRDLNNMPKGVCMLFLLLFFFLSLLLLMHLPQMRVADDVIRLYVCKIMWKLFLFYVIPPGLLSGRSRGNFDEIFAPLSTNAIWIRNAPPIFF